MEIRLTVHAPGRLDAPVETVVAWSGRRTTADLREALSAHLGIRVGHLLLAGQPLADDVVVGMPPLLHGASIAVMPGSPDGRNTVGGAQPSVLELVAVGGPDAARAHPLRPPGFALGRSPGSGFHLADDALSRIHARLDVGTGGVVLDDRGSTNGVTVDGVAITGPTRVDTSSTVVVGRTTLRLRRTAGAGLPCRAAGDGTVVLAPSGAPLTAVLADQVVDAPPVPTEPVRGRVPWLAALLPVPVAGVLTLFVGPMMLAFAALGPVVLLGSALGDRWSARRSHRRALAEHVVAVDRARDRLRLALAQECRQRHLAHPDAHATLQRAEHRLAGLWSGGDLTVRLGLGDVPARTSWVEAGESTRTTASGVPVVVDLAETPVLGVVGPREYTDGVVAHCIGQLVTRMPPGRLRVDVPGRPVGGWVERLTHTRRGRHEVVVVTDGAVADPVAVVGAARAREAIVVLTATSADHLPPGVGAVLEAGADGRSVLLVGGRETALVADVVGEWWPDRLSRALAPVRAAGGSTDHLEPPAAVGLADVHGIDVFTADAVLDRWAGAGARGPVAVVGATSGAPLVLDLRRDGPHVLVGGTTGSGKSEFLRTFVTSLAASSPPDELTLVLVDFKGGAAFGPCAALPQVVGLVTDLDEHLVDRALASLGAELRRRERLLAAKGAGDLDDYRRQRRTDDDPLPRLVVVVDELRALVDELPGFVSGLVRLAAQGRSLGIHLVLATQRPAGTITPEIQANVDLRVAFRVRDRSDSVDVVDDPVAASLPAGTPGRAVARGADGRLVEFQAALVAHRDGPRQEFLTVRTHGDRAAAADITPDRATETAAVVAVVAEAHRRRPGHATHPPWLPPLPSALRPGQLCAGHRTVVVVDEPDRQRVVPVDWGACDLWRFVGRSRSGRSTALRAVVSAGARALPVEALHVHVVDGSGALADLGPLAQVGTLTRPGDRAAVEALVAHLGEEVARRLDVAASGSDGAGTEPAAPTVLVVVDGWEALVEHDDPSTTVAVTDALLAVLRDGRAVGIVGAVSGGRALLGPRWSSLGGDVSLLGEVDPLDAAVAGLPATAVPRRPPPGRAVRVTDAREAQVVVHLPSGGPVGAPLGPHARRPWRFRHLPTVVRRHELPDDDVAGLVIGVGGPLAATMAWHPRLHGRRLLVAGPPGSGRSTLLHVLATSARHRAVPTVVVSPAPADWDDRPVDVLGPADVDRLVALRQHCVDVHVLVDDVDRLDDTPVLPVLREIADLVGRDGGALVAATSSVGLPTRFRGLDVELARHRAGILLRPRAGDGDLLGVRRVRVSHDGVGRGAFVHGGTVTEMQVLSG
ncbi:MAG: FtsK/SpoIIIE domain-containing protein [Phycicoccus sp.]